MSLIRALVHPLGQIKIPDSTKSWAKSSFAGVGVGGVDGEVEKQRETIQG